MLRYLLTGSTSGLLACAMNACGQKNVQVSAREATGSKEERIAQTAKLLTIPAPLPGTVLDAHFIEETVGDGRLGPSDFTTFYALSVSSNDVKAWKSALAKSKPANTFSNDDEIKRAAPKKAKTWWVSAADLPKLEYFSPHSLTGNANGWVGIAPDGRIFIHTFTM